MDNSEIKIAFSKVKEDIFYLVKEFSSLKKELDEVKNSIDELSKRLNLILIQTQNQKLPTLFNNPTDKPTVPQEIKGLKNQFLSTSTGNKGVPTNQQTNQQTFIGSKNPIFEDFNYKNKDFNSPNIEENIRFASDILDSLDVIKKEIRQKFKKLTPQEMQVFSIIYQLEEQNPDNVTYKLIAESLNLSESSIRDYVQKMLNKGIPIKKEKINNKLVILKISKELNKINGINSKPKEIKL